MNKDKMWRSERWLWLDIPGEHLFLVPTELFMYLLWLLYNIYTMLFPNSIIYFCSGPARMIYYENGLRLVFDKLKHSPLDEFVIYLYTYKSFFPASFEVNL